MKKKWKNKKQNKYIDKKKISTWSSILINESNLKNSNYFFTRNKLCVIITVFIKENAWPFIVLSDESKGPIGL